jgi:hypothetical protein
MYQNENHRVRWLGVCLVLGLHIVGFMALRLIDRLTIKDNPIAPYVMLLTSQSPVPKSAEATKRISTWPTYTPPHIALSPTPDIVIRSPSADRIHVPQVEMPNGLNLTVNPDARPTMEQMFPSAAERQRRFFKDQAQEDDLSNRDLAAKGPAEHSCEVYGVPEDRLPIPSSNGIAKVFVPGFSMSFGGKTKDRKSGPDKPCL